MTASRIMSLGEINAYADVFRSYYAPGTTGHLDVEALAELRLGMRILPRENVRSRTQSHGWLCCDGKTIIVDAGFQLSDPIEYQSFLSHEIGHKVLHHPMLPKRPPVDRIEFVRFHDDIPETVKVQIEWEAREFGRRFQVPRQELTEVFSEAVEVARDSYSNFKGPARLFLEGSIAWHFGVSEARAHRRISDERLWRVAKRAFEVRTPVRVMLRELKRPRPAISGGAIE